MNLDLQRLYTRYRRTVRTSAAFDEVAFGRPSRSCAARIPAWFLALIAAASPAPGFTDTDGTLTRIDDADLAAVALGEQVYRANCAACHGAELEGQPDWRSRDTNGLLPAPPHDENGHTWHHADDLLFEIVKYGPGPVIGDPVYRSAMPAYDSILSDQEIVAALVWIKSRWPAQERDWQAEVNRGQLGTDDAPDADRPLLERLFK